MIQSEINKNIFFITGVDSNDLFKLARFTKTIALPSIDLMDNSFVLGRCEIFSIEKIEFFWKF